MKNDISEGKIISLSNYNNQRTNAIVKNHANSIFGDMMKDSDKEMLVAKYHKDINALAKTKSGRINNLINNEIITQEDIMKIDADLENEARAENDKGFLEKVANSNLTLTEKLVNTYPYLGRGASVKEIETIQGEINGQDVKIKCIKFLLTNYKAWINDKKLSEADAKELFKEYYPIASKRMEAINKLIEENKKKTIH